MKREQATELISAPSGSLGVRRVLCNTMTSSCLIIETGQMVQGRLVAIFIIVGIFVVVCISAIFYAMRRNARASNDAESRCGFLVCAKTDTTKIAEK